MHVLWKRETYKVLVGKPERRRPLAIPQCRREDDIKMGVKEIGWESMDWINLGQVGLR
jgi:hypothetical protein